MSIAQKIKAVLDLGEKKQTELGEYMGMTAQTVANKINRDNWSASDLIKVADFTGSKLAYIFPDGTQVVFSIDEAHETNRQKKLP